MTLSVYDRAREVVLFVNTPRADQWFAIITAAASEKEEEVKWARRCLRNLVAVPEHDLYREGPIYQALFGILHCGGTMVTSAIVAAEVLCYPNLTTESAREAIIDATSSPLLRRVAARRVCLKYKELEASLKNLDAIHDIAQDVLSKV